MSDNPFETLKLPPTATPDEIVCRGAQLMQKLTEEPARDAIRQAVRALTETDEVRTLHALLTHPAPCYAVPDLERLAAAHRRPPRSATEAVCPPVDVAEFREMMLSALATEPPAVTLPLERVAGGELAEEIERQTAEALWQSLPGQPRG